MGGAGGAAPAVGGRVVSDAMATVGAGVIIITGGSDDTASGVLDRNSTGGFELNGGLVNPTIVGERVLKDPSVVSVGNGVKGAGAGGSVLLLIGGLVNTGSVVLGASTVPPPPLGWYVSIVSGMGGSVKSIVSGTGGFVVTWTVGVGTG